MRKARLPAALALAAALALSACGGSVPGEVIAPSSPPKEWPTELEAERRNKDRFFREDPTSPLPDARKGAFSGLEYFPPDPAWYFHGRLTPVTHPTTFPIAGSTGEKRVAEHWAIFTFLAEGRPHTLQVYRLFEPGEPEGHPFLPFLDATTGRETYPAGRYVEPDFDGSGNVTVDFNRAYYPWCAYGKTYDCPLVPAENRLDIAVRAGERGGLHEPLAAVAIPPGP